MSKISQLTTAAKPLSGAEKVVMNQNGTTVTAALSDIKTYTGGGGADISGLSANFALKNTNNNFTKGQTINGPLTATYITLSGGSDPLSLSLRRGDGTGTFGIIDHDKLIGTDIIALGRSAGSYVTTPTPSNNNNVLIGNYSGYNAGNIQSVISLGSYSALNAGSGGGYLASVITIGENSGTDIASANGYVSNVISIGNTSGTSVGQGGTVNEVIGIGTYTNEWMMNGSNVISIGNYANSNVGVDLPELNFEDVISIGNGAGQTIAAANSIGTLNNTILIGKQAGYSLGSYSGSTVTDVVFIGRSAGSNTSNGADSLIESVVGIGYQSCIDMGILSNSSVTDSIFIGSYSGGSINENATVNNMVSIGSNAGSNAGAVGGTVSHVTSVGSDAASYIGSSFGTVNNVIAIGQFACEYGGSAGSISDVVAIGNGAGSALTTGSNVIAIGKEAANNVSNTSDSIYIGRSSGSGQQSSKNTFIGDITNTSDPSNVNLSACIALGYGATPSARNTIAIGSATTPLSVVPGKSFTSSLSGLKIMINGVYYTIPLLA